MFNSKSRKKTAQVSVSQADGQNSGLSIGSVVAPAVALLMMGEAAMAADPDSEDDSLPPVIGVPEPSTLSLLAVGAVVVGTARYIQNKRRK